MRGIVGRFWFPCSGAEVRGRGELAKRLRVGCVEGRIDFLGDVEDSPDTALDEGWPIASVVFGAEPYARKDLNWTIEIGHGRRTVLVLSMKSRGDGSIREGKDGRTACTRSGKGVEVEGALGR